MYQKFNSTKNLSDNFFNRLNKICLGAYLKRRNKKRGDYVVNLDFEKFTKAQQAHQSKYLGGKNNQKPGLNDPEYNNQENTDKSPGAAGRE
jgi:hypothetical protein